MGQAEYLSTLLRGPGFKVFGLAFLTLLMAIPLIFVAVIVEERKGRSSEAKREVGQAWGGGTQLLAGPFLVVPVNARVTRRVDGRDTETTERSHIVSLPARADYTVKLATESRHRGIFAVSVYTARVAIAGRFDALDVSRHTKAGDELLWNEAFLSLGVTDNRGFTDVGALEWGQTGQLRRAMLEPGAEAVIVSRAGAHAITPQAGDRLPFDFKVEFGLKGSEALRFLPVGQRTVVSLAADWAHPSFQGAYLPNERAITPTDFTALWDIPNLARSFPQTWRLGAGSMNIPQLTEASFGVSLIESVDFYQKIMRALKYAILFIGFSFLAFFLIEVRANGRIHLVQYLLIGASQCVFYVLLLAFAEQIGFAAAYIIGAAATVALIAAYGGLALRSTALGLAISGVLLVIYAVLYSLLELEDYALLAGSLAAFAALAVTMFATARIDWSVPRPPAKTAAS